MEGGEGRREKEKKRRREGRNQEKEGGGREVKGRNTPHELCEATNTAPCGPAAAAAVKRGQCTAAGEADASKLPMHAISATCEWPLRPRAVHPLGPHHASLRLQRASGELPTTIPSPPHLQTPSALGHTMREPLELGRTSQTERRRLAPPRGA